MTFVLFNVRMINILFGILRNDVNASYFIILTMRTISWTFIVVFKNNSSVIWVLIIWMSSDRLSYYLWIIICVNSHWTFFTLFDNSWLVWRIFFDISYFCRWRISIIAIGSVNSCRICVALKRVSNILIFWVWSSWTMIIIQISVIIILCIRDRINIVCLLFRYIFDELRIILGNSPN